MNPHRVETMVVLLTSVLASCAATPPKRVLEVPPAPRQMVPSDDVVLAVGDQLEVTYFKAYWQETPYRLGPLDRIKVTVANRPELAHETAVLPDGTVTLPRLGSVPVAGKTPAQLVEELVKAYVPTLESPQVDVLILEARGDIEDFFAILLQSSEGPSRRVPVTQEGIVHLPLIEPVRVAHRTLADVRRDIRAGYAAKLPGAHVAVALSSKAPRHMAVFGEVTKGGVFPIDDYTTPMSAIAMAGGLTDRAHAAQVLLVEAEADGKLTVNVLDVASALAGLDAAPWSMRIRPSDVIYVPRSAVADVNVFVDQYLRRMIPVGVGVGIPIGVTN